MILIPRSVYFCPSFSMRMGSRNRTFHFGSGIDLGCCGIVMVGCFRELRLLSTDSIPPITELWKNKTIIILLQILSTQPHHFQRDRTGPDTITPLLLIIRPYSFLPRFPYRSQGPRPSLGSSNILHAFCNKGGGRNNSRHIVRLTAGHAPPDSDTDHCPCPPPDAIWFWRTYSVMIGGGGVFIVVNAATDTPQRGPLWVQYFEITPSARNVKAFFL